MVALLVLLVHPSLHHVIELDDGLGSVASKVSEETLLGEAVLEALDDIFVGDVGAGFEEAPSVGPQGLVLLLLALS